MLHLDGCEAEHRKGYGFRKLLQSRELHILGTWYIGELIKLSRIITHIFNEKRADRFGSLNTKNLRLVYRHLRTGPPRGSSEVLLLSIRRFTWRVENASDTAADSGEMSPAVDSGGLRE
jgi:hypothetical protein